MQQAVRSCLFRQASGLNSSATDGFWDQVAGQAKQNVVAHALLNPMSGWAGFSKAIQKMVVQKTLFMQSEQHQKLMLLWESRSIILAFGICRSCSVQLHLHASNHYHTNFATFMKRLTLHKSCMSPAKSSCWQQVECSSMC